LALRVGAMSPPPPGAKNPLRCLVTLEAAVQTAINRGAITPSRKRHWVSLLENDPGMFDVLAKVPDELAVPTSELGHSADTGTGDRAESGWYY
jgi:hypothetical protein